MKNSPLKLAFAVFGIAVAIFLSCSDGPILVFPGKDEPIAPPSSSGEEASSSSCDDADKCNGQCYNRETQFCYNSSKAGYFCGINPQELYDPDIYQCKPEINPNGIYLKTGITDGRDNNKHYNAVLIGGQVWMAENLNYDVPGNDTDVCYSNIPVNCATYGRLYNWSTATSGICPSGWHLPSDAEWTALTNFAGGASAAGTKLKAASGWNTGSGYIPGTNDYGFSALPDGDYLQGSGFINVGSIGVWWSGTESSASYAYYRGMNYDITNVRSYTNDKSYLFSVRCVKN